MPASWRSSKKFLLATVAFALFTDLILYGFIVPVLPYLLRNKIHVPSDRIQFWISNLLAIFASASVVFSPIAGYIASHTSSRKSPFLAGLACLIAATALLWAGKNLAVLSIARVLQGASSGFVWCVGLALIVDTCGQTNLGTTLGTIFSVISAGDLLSPVAGGLLWDVGREPALFGVAFGFLLIDVFMRLAIIERGPRTASAKEEDDETEPLLPVEEQERYKLPEEIPAIFKPYPVVYCFKDSTLTVTFLLILIQASLLGALDATIPKYVQDIFDFSPTRAGLIFIPLQIPNLIFGPIAGWLVDKKGARLITTIGYCLLAPAFILLRIPHSGDGQIAIMSVILAFVGLGLSSVSSGPVVEQSDMIDKFDRANPGRFGPRGPFASLYGLSSMAFSGGLALGPWLAGTLKDRIGFGNAMLVTGALFLFVRCKFI